MRSGPWESRIQRCNWLTSNSDAFDFAGIEKDFDIVLAAIKSWSCENVKGSHVSDIAAINHKTLDAFKPVRREVWMEAVKDSERRFV